MELVCVGCSSAFDVMDSKDEATCKECGEVFCIFCLRDETAQICEWCYHGDNMSGDGP